MTKISVFGESPIEKKEKEPIEFKKRLYHDGSCPDVLMATTDSFSEVQLYARGVDMDIILAWKEDNSGNVAKGSEKVYLGHWNDGVL